MSFDSLQIGTGTGVGLPGAIRLSSLTNMPHLNKLHTSLHDVCKEKATTDFSFHH